MGRIPAGDPDRSLRTEVHMNKTDLAIYIQNEEQLRRAESLLDRIEQERNYTGMVELAGILEELHNDNLEEEICALYTEAADEGKVPEAMVRLALIYRDKRISKNSAEKSFRYAYEAARLGNTEAEYVLAELFQGCHNTLALYWMKHAANKGHVEAARGVAELYDEMKKHELAETFYRKALELGDESAAKKVTWLGKLFRILKYS